MKTGIKIKQLKWKNRFESASEFGIKAQTPFCTYTLIDMEGTRVAKGIHLSSMDDLDVEVASFDQGKKLAQEDFERRVRGCLITEPTAHNCDCHVFYDIKENSQDLDTDIVDIVNEEFWNLI